MSYRLLFVSKSIAVQKRLCEPLAALVTAVAETSLYGFDRTTGIFIGLVEDGMPFCRFFSYQKVVNFSRLVKGAAAHQPGRCLRHQLPQPPLHFGTSLEAIPRVQDTGHCSQKTTLSGNTLIRKWVIGH
jgi:hypothetical protein